MVWCLVRALLLGGRAAGDTTWSAKPVVLVLVAVFVRVLGDIRFLFWVLGLRGATVSSGNYC
jgi:hypothetical protein